MFIRLLRLSILCAYKKNVVRLCLRPTLKTKVKNTETHLQRVSTCYSIQTSLEK